MSDPFFISSKSSSVKRKKSSLKPDGKKKANLKRDIDIDTDDSDDSEVNFQHSDEDSTVVEESAAEKRLRIAKEYIQKLEEHEMEQNSDRELDQDAIAHRLKNDHLEDMGRLQLLVSHKVDSSKFSLSKATVLKGHKFSVTAAVFSPDQSIVYSSGKDCCIFKWDVKTNRRLYCVYGKHITKGLKKKQKSPVNCDGHTDHILCLAVTHDGKYLASGSKDSTIRIYECASQPPMKLAHVFYGHKGAVTGLAFRMKSYQLFSASTDKCIKVWNLENMAYVETLFGHQDAAVDIDSLLRERAISSGSRDRSVRLWKIVEESQLVFEPSVVSHLGGIVKASENCADIKPFGSMDCVKFITEEFFMSGSDDGTLYLWNIAKKKPIYRKPKAHPGNFANSWITSLACCRFSDLVASAAGGNIRLWKCSPDYKGLSLLCEINPGGFVNGMNFTASGSHLVIAVGQEHRLGRWDRVSSVKNQVIILPIL